MDIKVPFHKPSIGDAEKKAVCDVLDSGWLTSGPKVLQFEEELCRVTGAKYAISTNSCTAALHLSLNALGVNSRSVVITTPITFPATINAIMYTGAQPVLVDIDPLTGNIDPARVLEVLNSCIMYSYTKAVILPVHYGGQPCDMQEIFDIADKYDANVVEDAAHAIGSQYMGSNIGALESDATCFSFYATKPITTGEGGAILTNNSTVANKCRARRLHGLSADAWSRYVPGEKYTEYAVENLGWKYNMSDINAAIGIAQLDEIQWFQEARRIVACRYTKAFSKNPYIQLPTQRENRINNWHLYPILVKNMHYSKFISHMADMGVQCSHHFVPIHQNNYYRAVLGYTDRLFPHADRFAMCEVSLPIWPMMSMASDGQIEYVIAAVNEVLSDA